MTSKPLLPPRRIKVKQLLVKREQEWDNRFVMGKLNKDDSDKKFIVKKVFKKAQIGSNVNSTQNDYQIPYFDDQKIEDLMRELYGQWNLIGIPEFHRQYYYEMVQFLNKIDAFERILKEINDLKVGRSPVQRMMKITKGREKCLFMLNQVVRDATIDNINMMDIVRRVSELISHLRILTLNLTEQFQSWKQSNDYGQYRYQEWVYKDWNYMTKITLDTKFLQEITIFQQFFQFSPYDDPFFLSLVKQAYSSDTEFNDYLLQHKMPRSIVKRIRKSEVIILEEQFYRLVQQKNLSDINSPTRANEGDQSFLESPHRQQNGQSNITSPIIINEKEESQVSLPKSSQKISLVAQQTNGKVAPTIGHVAPPNATVGTINQHVGLINGVERTSNIKSLIKDNNLELCSQVIKHSELKDTIDRLKTESDPQYVKSFNFDNIYDIAIYGQESCLLFVYQGSVVCYIYQPKNVGMILCSIDSNCVTVRRWVIHFMLGKTEQLFIQIQQIFLLLLQNDCAQEIQLSLYHFDQEEKYGESKQFKLDLKQLGYKWKQQVNDNNVRYTLYQLKKPIIETNIKQSEPIICQIGKVVTRSINVSSQENIHITQDNKLLEIRNIDIKVCDLAFHTHFNSIKNLAITNEDDTKLLEKIIKAKGQLPATKQVVFKSQDECQLFFQEDGKKLIDLEQSKPNVEFDCQLTNIQLRWVQAREVLYKKLKYIEIPKNENELVLKGINEFFQNPIYLVSTIDPKFTVFFVEFANKEELEEVTQNISFYTQAIAQFTDNKEIVTQDLLVPQHRVKVMNQDYCITFNLEVPNIFNNCIQKDIDQTAIILHGTILMGIIQEEIVAKFERPLISVIYNHI